MLFNMSTLMTCVSMCLQLSSKFKSQCVFSHQPSSQKICTKFWFTKFWSIKLIEPSWNPRQETRKILSSDPNCKYLGFKTSVKYLHIIEWEKIRLIYTILVLVCHNIILPMIFNMPTLMAVFSFHSGSRKTGVNMIKLCSMSTLMASLWMSLLSLIRFKEDRGGTSMSTSIPLAYYSFAVELEASQYPWQNSKFLNLWRKFKLCNRWFKPMISRRVLLLSKLLL